MIHLLSVIGGFFLGVIWSVVGSLTAFERWDGGHGCIFGIAGALVALASTFFIGLYSLALVAVLGAMWTVVLNVAVRLGDTYRQPPTR